MHVVACTKASCMQHATLNIRHGTRARLCALTVFASRAACLTVEWAFRFGRHTRQLSQRAAAQEGRDGQAWVPSVSRATPPRQQTNTQTGNEQKQTSKETNKQPSKQASDSGSWRPQCGFAAQLRDRGLLDDAVRRHLQVAAAAGARGLAEQRALPARRSPRPALHQDRTSAPRRSC